ncbi:ubiquitin-protein ligase E3A [Cucurbitaria berberidis CBS 394.84]|uniref:HECT-type E3 ubiquitin transferase n=1 Tax=Cucurbitaria berberidis CBS 394.84 TaxID=1168544 RepID=A0A9P4GGF4_9PLEO|nr:ubiquitin-protein ligase E3A [Cucurbitaria berberidis CBS 394.84]KAF1845100.1 ubiquitin-protein ligase E3A [Cucurbitaria berberidis CBS 394.84]
MTSVDAPTDYSLLRQRHTSLHDMSAPDGGLQHPRHASRSCSSSTSSSASTDGEGSRRRARSSPGLAHRLSNVIDLREPSRIVECSQIERQLRFQHLVRQYLSQILYGCKSAYCDTPTCFSCNKRNASKPYRPPTQLTARTLAHYLASQNNPIRGLCPHELKVLPNSVEIDGAIGTVIRRASNGVDRECSVYPVLRELAQHGDTDKSGATHVKAAISGENRAQDIQQSVVDAVNRRHQTKIDPKSLGQNLYDSVSMIYSYSKQIPSPMSIFALLRSPEDVPQRHTETSLGASSNAAFQTEIQTSMSSETSPLHSIAQPSTPRVNNTPRIVRQHSQQNLRAHTNLQTNQTVSQVLSNGQQIHRIPYHPPNAAIHSKMCEPTESATLDGTSESPRLSIRKTGKKNFTIGGGSLTTLDQTKPPAAPHGAEKPQNLGHHTAPAIPAASNLNCDILDELKEDVYCHRKDQSADFNFVVDYDTNRRSRPTKSFVNRSLFYTLSDPDTLLDSFHDSNNAFKDSPLPHLDSARLSNSFRDWNQRNGALIFDSLWIAVEALFTPPPEIDVQKSPRLRPSRKTTSTDIGSGQSSDQRKGTTFTPRYLSNREAAHIVMICIHALTSSVSPGWTHTWTQLRKLRSWGIIIPNAASNADAFAHPYLNLIDELEYEPAIRLADRLLRGIGARTCFEHILASLSQKKRRRDDTTNASTSDALVDIVVQHLKVVERVALVGKRRMRSTPDSNEDPGWTVTATFMEWLRTIIIKKWDSKAEINKWSSVGTAVMLLDKLHANCNLLNLRPNMFEIPFFNERLDIEVEPFRFVDWEEQPNTFHIFQYSNLFPAQHLVAYFRTINFTSMVAQYDHATRIHQMHRSLDMFIREPYWWLIKSRMRVTLRDYLVLDVSRENPLKDTLDQLWGQEKRMLLKPLKVKMGQREGEVGLDHGGVTYEFFRVVLSEAFKPDNGMFTIDPQTHMTWFQPRTLEPDWKFEMLGILFSLAVYNGITLPVTFPLALYHFLLPPDSPFRNREVQPDSLEFIKDGWPGLAKAFQDLLAWSDGDVGDVMMREYAFSYDVFGQKVDHDMRRIFDHRKPGRPNTSTDIPQEELPMVTNENREQFVRDYVGHLTYLSVAPQLWAFFTGFVTCMNPKSLHFFTPSTLRNLVEGFQHISIPDLKRCTRYEDGYSATHRTILDFWATVEQFNQDDCRHLLEFVTASDRVPVTGYDSITFHIERVGGQPESLPTSSTCFGKLYLPEYPDRETLSKKLKLAIQNSQGFGVV